MQMNEQPAAKRSWFAPIVLSLLVFSLIGNVALYSTKLLHDQTFRQEEGERIIRSAWDASAHTDALQAALQALRESKDAAARIQAKQAVGFAFEQASGLIYLVDTALPSYDGGTSRQPRSAAQFIEGIESALRAVGNEASALTAAETAYVNQLIELYTRMREELSAFPYTELTAQNALRSENGDGWVELARQLLAEMNELSVLTVN